jgi:hypothetical protein
VLRWNGTSWGAAHPVSSGELDGVAAITAGDAWGGGARGSRDHGAALGRQRVDCGADAERHGRERAARRRAAGSTDVWAVGGDATSTLAEHYSACAPSATTEPATDTTQGGAPSTRA